MMIRVDDYPTGIRPMQKGQLEMFDRMLAELPVVHLGIVPITYIRMKHKLTLPHVIPCVHGYEHGYAKYSELLKDDPTNKDTIGIFDEYEGLTDAEILFCLQSGKAYLEQEFDRTIDTYIPCCNVLTPRLAELIRDAGFTRILCENVVQSPIPIVKSDYYGKLDNMTGTNRIITLHITWEWDTVQEKGFDYWKGLVREKL